MSDPETYRVFIKGQLAGGKPPGELWPAAKRFLGAEEAARLLKVPEPTDLRPVPAPNVPKVRTGPPAPKEGIGTELKAVITELRLKQWANCNACNQLAGQMNAGGPEWVAANRATIIARLRQARKELKWSETLTAAFGVGTTRMGWRLDLADLEGSLLEEAIRRWQAKEATGGPPGTILP